MSSCEKHKHELEEQNTLYIISIDSSTSVDSNLHVFLKKKLWNLV